METDAQVLSRVRRRLNAAKVQSKMSLEQLFNACDHNKSGSLDIKELEHAVRCVLKVPDTTVCHYELKLLYHTMDTDKKGGLTESGAREKGGVDIAELFAYLAQGSRRPEDEEARKSQRLQRVRKNLQMGFQKLSAKERGEMAIRKLFNRIDLDGEGKLSPFEFNYFVRNGLKLSRWDVMNEDLVNFYKVLDVDGDGLEVEELIDFIKGNNRKVKEGGDFSMYEGRSAPKAERKKTHKQVLEEMRPSSSVGSLIRPLSPRELVERRCVTPGSQSPGPGVAAYDLREYFALRPSSSFVNLGRTRPGIVRLPNLQR